MFMVVVEDDQAETVTTAIQNAAYTGFPGDGRTFVTDVEASYTLHTGESGL
jgi:nitrogen regulatory protein PII